MAAISSFLSYFLVFRLITDLIFETASLLHDPVKFSDITKDLHYLVNAFTDWESSPVPSRFNKKASSPVPRHFNMEYEA